MDIKEEIQNFMSKHEILVSQEMRRDNFRPRFTNYGTRAGCRALFDIISLLDDNTKLKVIEIMKSKKIS